MHTKRQRSAERITRRQLGASRTTRYAHELSHRHDFDFKASSPLQSLNAASSLLAICKSTARCDSSGERKKMWLVSVGGRYIFSSEDSRELVRYDIVDNNIHPVASRVCIGGIAQW